MDTVRRRIASATITARGRELADKLDPERQSFGMDGVRACSLIARAAKTHGRLAEEECNGPALGEWSQRWADRIEKRTAQIEENIRALVASLGDGFGVVFSGDPRGSTVKITTPDKRTDDWGHIGICANW